MAHKTKIGGTAYEIGGGKVLVGGTAYSIDKGRTKVDGTGYDITFGTQIGSLAVGSSVFMNVGGTRTEFLVVHQGNPDSTLYDASCDGTWLLMQDAYIKRVWNTKTSSDYKNADIHTYLDNTFLGLLEDDLQTTIKQIKLPYMSNVSNGAVSSGANGMPAKVFLLSLREVADLNSLDEVTQQYFPKDGSCLTYFAGLLSDGDQRRIAKYNGASVTWWLRSSYSFSPGYNTIINEAGSTGADGSTQQHYARPALILPSETSLDSEFNIIA